MLELNKIYNDDCLNINLRRGRRMKDTCQICETCNKKEGIPPRVPWGKCECEECRAKTGRCGICGINRNDCCC